MVSYTHTLCIALVVIGSASYAPGARGPHTSAQVPPESTAPEGSPKRAAETFLRAFDELEWDQFRSYVADDMTMFVPFGQTPSRVEGREAIEGVFESFFRSQRRQLADSGAPMTQGLNPRDMTIQLAGVDAAVVTFHVGAERSPVPRSLVLRRTGGGWKVIHWDASAIATGAGGSTSAATPRATVSESVLRSYVGEYQAARDEVMTITLEGSTLVAHLMGPRKVAIRPESSTRFLYKAADARMTFRVDATGRVTGLILHQSGRTQTLQKVK